MRGSLSATPHEWLKTVCLDVEGRAVQLLGLTEQVPLHFGSYAPRAHSVFGPSPPQSRRAWPSVGPVVVLGVLRSYKQSPTMMIKKLSAVGNSLDLIIERPLLELLDIFPKAS